MATQQFKAYLSYSHKDEAWAKWLHRALEIYRVPRKLVGTNTGAGLVPARVRPVFRDRDDMSSSTDLTETLKQALADSENLIVICSPAAFASHWVNEEIRTFADFGKSARIFCVIVDGNPASDRSGEGCIPPALAEIGFREPLAADARKWADGKQLAKLKLVAGLLGLRLDELRQRDMQRRRKQRLLTGLAGLAAVALTMATVFSYISQKHEREKAEQLATFVVDLGERLKSDSDLETLALISTEASKNLQHLDQDKLSAETRRKVALAVRQMGQVNQFRNKPEEASEAFTISRDLLSNLHKKHPEDAQALFELGNAEFFIGNRYFLRGEIDKAMKHMQNYFDFSQKLLASDPENPDWIEELAYAHNNLAALQMDSAKSISEATLAHVAEATKLMEKVISLKPDDEAVNLGYAMVVAWAADAQLQACNLAEASKLRTQVKQLAEKTSGQNLSNNELKQSLAFALTGVARMQTMMGEYAAAKQSYIDAIAILQLLADTDPSNVIAKQEVTHRRVLLTKLLVDLGEMDEAALILKETTGEFEPLSELPQRDAEFQRDYVDFLIISAKFENQANNTKLANQLLQSALRYQQDLIGEGRGDFSDSYRQASARYLWWTINDTDNTDFSMGLLEESTQGSNKFQSCNDADAEMRMSVIAQDRIKAENEAEYLLSKGYAAPDFVEICRQQNLCPTLDPGT